MFTGHVDGDSIALGVISLTTFWDIGPHQCLLTGHLDGDSIALGVISLTTFWDVGPHQCLPRDNSVLNMSIQPLNDK